MTKGDYDLAVVGGGLAGSALAIAMARHGAKVLVVEREEAFKDRVRGEGMTPWGVAEARDLGIYDLLRDSCGYEVRFWDVYMGPSRVSRDVVETTAQRAPLLNFSHPEMQETLLAAAKAAGVEVRRGSSVTGVSPGEVPRMTVERDGASEEVSARLVVGTDGRSSRVRTWAGFTPNRDPPRLFVGGVLLEGASAPMKSVSLIQSFGRSAIFFPQRGDRLRAYVVYHRDVYPERLTGPADLPRFIEAAVKTGAPAEWLAGVRAVGPLATFEGADVWVKHPYKSGVVLVGDAAASSDPSWGQGLSLTLRDVRTLRDELLRSDDWDAAGNAYAEAHDRYYEALRTVEDWYTTLFMEVGPDADARRARALPLIQTDPTRLQDAFLSGPNEPVGEVERARFFGE
jgi:menaquinone-9 beta-reductase